MPAPHVVLDIKTVLDEEAVACAYDLQPDDAGGIKAAIGDEFPKAAFHKIVCIAAIALTYDIPHKRWSVLEVASLHAGDRSEKDLVGEFLRYVGCMRPAFVGYNSLGLDLTVVRTRAMQLRLKSTHIAWRDFRPFLDHHVDLCETLSARGRGRMTLDEVARVFGVGAKTSGMDGSRVDDLARDDAYQAIADCCLDSVAATAALFLLHQNFAGILDEEALARARASVTRACDIVRRERPAQFLQDGFGRLVAIG